MKVILDTNIYISYFLAGRKSRTITRIVEACIVSIDIELVVPLELIDEIVDAINRKPYLRKNIRQEDIDDLLEVLSIAATTPPPLESILPLSRDPNDDYLLAYGLVESVAYLVTGDDDLLALNQVDSLQIIEVGDFADILDLA